jgi:hypothetical protein
MTLGRVDKSNTGLNLPQLPNRAATTLCAELVSTWRSAPAVAKSSLQKIHFFASLVVNCPCEHPPLQPRAAVRNAAIGEQRL